MIKKAAIINDLSGFGKCSLTAAIAILSVMGIQPCPMPTAVLTNQSGYKDFFCADMTENLPYYKEMWKKNSKNFEGIYSGYVANKKQIDIISDFIDEFRCSYTKVLVDPVMGDNGRLYKAYDRQTCEKIKELSKKADLITPNLTEFCIISDTDYNSLTEKSIDENYLEIISEIAKETLKHSEQSIAVTGILKDEFIYNGVFTKDGCKFVKSEKYGGGFSGTGDIFASILCGCMLRNEDLFSSVNKAVDFLKTAVADTVKAPYDRNDGINFEKFLGLLI